MYSKADVIVHILGLIMLEQQRARWPAEKLLVKRHWHRFKQFVYLGKV